MMRRKNQMKKTLLSLLLVFCLLIVVAPAMDVEADAATTYTEGNWTYSVTDGLATVTGYTGTSAKVVVPEFFGYYQVTAIGEKAFAGNATMTEVVLPESLISIGKYAFNGCVGLTSIELPPNLATLGARAFQNCTRLEEIIFNCKALNDIANAYPDNGQPFYGAGRAGSGITVTFTDSCTKIPVNLFNAIGGESVAAKVTKVVMSDSVISVGTSAFRGCVSLETVDFGNGVTSIAGTAFGDCRNLTTIDLSDQLQSIGEYAFSGCSALQNVSFPTSLTSIGKYAFNGCVSFTTITLPQNLATLSARAFQNCTKVEKINIKCVNLNNINVSYADYGQPFYGVGTASDGVYVYFTSTCTRVPASIFYAYNSAYAPKITTVKLNDSVTAIGNDAFRQCADLKEFIMGDGVTTIGTSAFDDCIGLTTVEWSSQLTTINEYAFSDCRSLTSGTLPASLATIGKYAFHDNTSLISLTLPKNLASLGARAFQNCTMLNKITVKSTSLGDIYVAYSDYGQPFYNAGSAGDGITVTFTSGATRVPARLFYARDGISTAPKITSVKLADSVTEVSESAFESCIYLKSVDLGKGLQAMGRYAFYGCSALKKMIIPSTATGIWAEAFKGCSELSYIRFLGDAPSFGSNAFSGITITAYYPNDAVWSEDAKAQYGGTVTWKGFDRAVIKTEPKTGYAKMGETVKTTVKAGGEELEYAWYVKNSGATKYSKSSVTSATYSTTMSDKSKNRLVYCVITDKYGYKVQTKTVALREQVSITSQSKTTYTKQGATAKATVKASGDGLKYAWYIKNANQTSYSKSSITGTTYSCTMNSTTKDRLVYCVVTDKYGKTARTETVRLRMAATITSQPTAVYAKSGTTAKATVKAVGDGLEYTWYIKNAGQTSYSKSSVTTSTYSVTMNSTTKDRRVYCVITDKYGKTVTSETMILRMAATITTQPKDASAANGSVAKTTVKAAGDGLTYTWYIKNAGASSYSKSSVTTASYSCKMSAATDGRTAYCVVTDKYGKTAKSTTVTFTMN